MTLLNIQVYQKFGQNPGNARAVVGSLLAHEVNKVIGTTNFKKLGLNKITQA